MKSQGLLLGFDARQGSREVALTWDAKRREEFLFRTDVMQPFSADTTVWPAVLESNLRPAVCIGHQDLWSDLECLRSSLLSPEMKVSDTYDLIAITFHSDTDSLAEVWCSEVPPTNPTLLSEASSFLGYDVTDKWLLSGLSNCGFLPDLDDVQALRHEWSGKLNGHHLFDNLKDALIFTELSDKRVTEHSPFFVVGLWSIPLG